MYLFIKKLTVVNIQDTTIINYIQNCSQLLLSRLTPYIVEISIIGMNFDIIDRLLVRYSAFVRYWREMGYYISYL
jgi:hypothetical protein